MSSLQQALIPEIEERLRKKCENLVLAHDPENSAGKNWSTLKDDFTFAVTLLSFWTDMPWQTVQTQIRRPLEEQS